jgi:hypothetical protein
MSAYWANVLRKTLVLFGPPNFFMLKYVYILLLKYDDIEVLVGLIDFFKMLDWMLIK